MTRKLVAATAVFLSSVALLAPVSAGADPVPLSHGVYLPPEIDAMELGDTKAMGIDYWGRPDQTDRTTPAISETGAHVVFRTQERLVKEDRNDVSDVYIRHNYPDPFGWTELISAGPDGIAMGHKLDAHSQVDVSADGRYVVFTSNSATSFHPNFVWYTPQFPTNVEDFGWAAILKQQPDVYLRDTKTDTTTLITTPKSSDMPWDAFGMNPVISADAKYIAFESKYAFRGGETGQQVYRHEVATGKTELVTHGSPVVDGSVRPYEVLRNNYEPDISKDGRYVAFSGMRSAHGAVQHVYLRDMRGGTLEQVSPSGVYSSHNPSVSGNARIVAFDSNIAGLWVIEGRRDIEVLVVDRGTKNITIASNQPAVTMSATAFQDMLVDIDPDEPHPGYKSSHRPMISSDGKAVAFESSEMIGKHDEDRDRDVYVTDLHTNRVYIGGLGSDGWKADGGSTGAAISGDGRFVGFIADDPTLDPKNYSPFTQTYLRFWQHKPVK